MYADFEVEIGQGVGRTYPITVIRSPAGEARSTMEFPYDEVALDSRLKDLQVALLRSGGVRRQVLTPEETGVRGFGQDIFDALLSGEARSRYDVSCREARNQGLGLRLKLRIRAPELARLPWEYLYDARVGEYICLSRDTPVVRFLETPRPIEPLMVIPPLRVLAMIVSPSDLPELDTERERERVERAVAPVQEAGLAELVWLEGETWRDLQRAMRSGPWHVFHFIGHGGFDAAAGEGVIALADERGRAQRLLATEVGRLLADHHPLRLVLLNSCEGARASRDDVFSSTAAVLVRRGLPAVLAMQHEITDRAAIEFARAFYEALAEGLPVDASVTEARKAVSLAVTNTVEWGTPVLYMRAPEGVIFEIPESARPVISSRPERSDEALETAYTEALSAYWVGDWASACDKLRAIVAENADYADAATKLREAEQRLAWSSLYTEAGVAEGQNDLATAIDLLAQLVDQAPDYLDAQLRLAELRTSARLEELLTEARRLSDAQQWPAVVAVFAEIEQLGRNYQDEDGLLAAAEEGARELEQRKRLDALYARAVRQMDSGHWAEAWKELREISETDPDHRETHQLLAKCESELAEMAAAKERAEQAATLYEEAAALLQANQARDALAKLDHLREVDPDFPDSEGIREQARAAGEAEEAQAEQQKRAASLYAEAVQALKSEQPEKALDKWRTVRELDPSFVDRRNVAASAEEELRGVADAPGVTTRRRRRWLPWAGAVVLSIAATGAIFYVAGSDESRSVSDSFEAGSLDRDVWSPYPSASGIEVNDGVLTIRVDAQDGQAGVRLSDYDFDVSQSIFVEARLRLDPGLDGGNVLMGWCCGMIDATCAIGPGLSFCFFDDRQDDPYQWATTGAEEDPGRWRTFRIEFDADEQRFTYFMDGEAVGSASPPSEDLYESGVNCLLRVHNDQGPTTVGYVDDFRMGPLDK
jgi:tetratricopeptide (TPR) repeat protein